MHGIAFRFDLMALVSDVVDLTRKFDTRPLLKSHLKWACPTQKSYMLK